MPASINVQAEKYNVFSIRAKYNNQQMIQKLRYSEFDAGCADFCMLLARWYSVVRNCSDTDVR